MAETRVAAPPLSVWISTVAVFVLFLLFTSLLFSSSPGFLAGAGSPFFQPLPKGEKVDVFLFGSSLLEFALPERALHFPAASGGMAISSHFMTRYSLTSAELEAPFQEAVRASPRIILIEAPVLIRDSDEIEPRPATARRDVLGDVPLFFRQHRMKCYAAVLQLKRGVLQILGEPVPKPKPLLARKVPGTFDWGAFALAAPRFRVPTITRLQPWVKRIAEARQKGIRVCLLDLPRPREAARFLTPTFASETEALLADLSDAGIPLLRFPRSLDQSTYFLDEGHLAAEGSVLYRNWLEAELAGLLQ